MLSLFNNKLSSFVVFAFILKAGISRNKLILALEPETASIFCQYLSIEKMKGSEPGFTVTKKGTEYMVVDLGGECLVHPYILKFRE